MVRTVTGRRPIPASFSDCTMRAWTETSLAVRSREGTYHPLRTDVRPDHFWPLIG